jgi:hypothetical protein
MPALFNTFRCRDTTDISTGQHFVSSVTVLASRILANSTRILILFGSDSALKNSGSRSFSIPSQQTTSFFLAIKITSRFILACLCKYTYIYMSVSSRAVSQYSHLIKRAYIELLKSYLITILHVIASEAWQSQMCIVESSFSEYWKPCVAHPRENRDPAVIFVIKYML